MTRRGAIKADTSECHRSDTYQTANDGGVASQRAMQQDESEVSDRELIDVVEAYESRAFNVEGQENVCANDRLVADVELLSSMQKDESGVSDRELIDAVEAYESHAAHVEGQENVCANDSPVADVELLAATTWLENYLQQRDVTKTGECPSVCPSVTSDHCICTSHSIPKPHIISSIIIVLPL